MLNEARCIRMFEETKGTKGTKNSTRAPAPHEIRAVNNISVAKTPKSGATYRLGGASG